MNRIEAKKFIFDKRNTTYDQATKAISLFSGGGISDLGFEAAGFKFVVQAEIEPNRAKLCQINFPESTCIVGDLSKDYYRNKVVESYLAATQIPLALLSITPPCQGMSSSNPGRGKIKDSDEITRDKRNLLLLNSIPIIKKLKPRVIVVENVPFALNKKILVRKNGKPIKLIDIFKKRLEKDYYFFSTIIQMADYGIPQLRRRAIVIAIQKNEPWLRELVEQNLNPWPKKSFVESADNGYKNWITITDWIKELKYPELDSRSSEKARHPKDYLHQVPNYDTKRYQMVADIPPYSGKNAYENKNCPHCGNNEIPLGIAHCNKCDGVLFNRPIVIKEDGTARLIKGFKSSYRRMPANKPARTITTSTSHIGSDYKIHPWENRVLSIREIADLQTVPRFYDWSPVIDKQQTYVIRKVVGEAIPAYFSYQLGYVLKKMLFNNIDYSILEKNK